MSSFTVDRSYKPRPYFCEGCGSAIGIIVRDSNRVTRLNVFRQVIRGSQIELYLDFPDGGMRMFGHAFYSVRGLNDGTVLCAHCGRECEWLVSRQALDQMIERLTVKSV